MTTATVSLTTIAVWLLAAVVGGANAADERGSRRCAGGLAHNEQTERGRYWYVCDDGQLVAKGCVSDDRRRINIWQWYDVDGLYRIQCVTDGDTNLAFAYKSCLYNGKEYYANEVWNDGHYLYQCFKENGQLRADVAGCIDRGREVRLNQKVTQGSFIYQCKRTVNGTCSLCPVGCVKEGRQYEIGDTFTNDGFWYSCTTESNGRIQIRCIGCLAGGQKLRDGDRYAIQDVLYECAVDGEKTQLRPVACISRENGIDQERRVECSWVEGKPPYQYEMTCKAEGDKAVRLQTRCNYKVANGVHGIDPNCYKIIDRSVVGCLKHHNTGNLQIRLFSIDDIVQAITMGLRYC